MNGPSASIADRVVSRRSIGSLAQHDAAARDARDVEQVVEQPRHVLGLTLHHQPGLAA